MKAPQNIRGGGQNLRDTEVPRCAWHVFVCQQCVKLKIALMLGRLWKKMNDTFY